jgi:hypothetical protein
MEDRIGRKTVVRGRVGRIAMHVSAFALVTAAVMACRDSTAPAVPGLSINAPKTIHFTSQPSGYHYITVPVTITNATDKQLHLGYCSESLERFTLPNWRFVWGPICLAMVIVLPPIEPGASLTITVNAEDTAPGYPGFRFTDTENIYRVKLGLFFIDEGTTRPVPDDQNASNPFRVVP